MFQLRVLNWEEIELHQGLLNLLKWLKHEPRLDYVHVSIFQFKIEFLLYLLDPIGDRLVQLHLVDVDLNVPLVEHFYGLSNPGQSIDVHVGIFQMLVIGCLDLLPHLRVLALDKLIDDIEIRCQFPKLQVLLVDEDVLDASEVVAG